MWIYIELIEKVIEDLVSNAVVVENAWEETPVSYEPVELGDVTACVRGMQQRSLVVVVDQFALGLSQQLVQRLLVGTCRAQPRDKTTGARDMVQEGSAGYTNSARLQLANFSAAAPMISEGLAGIRTGSAMIPTRPCRCDSVGGVALLLLAVGIVRLSHVPDHLVNRNVDDGVTRGERHGPVLQHPAHPGRKVAPAPGTRYL